jgi:hypothetical protein
MRTPAGVDCRYYYEDFNRGRDTQECRLILQNPDSLPWTPDVCEDCPVPEITRANGSPNLRLTPTISKRFGLFKHLKIDAHCAKHRSRIDNPITGCRECAEDVRLT